MLCALLKQHRKLENDLSLGSPCASPCGSVWETDRYATQVELAYRIYLVGIGKGIRVRSYGVREREGHRKREKKNGRGEEGRS